VKETKMEKDLIVMMCPENLMRDEETFKNFREAMVLTFKGFGRDVDLMFLPVGHDVKVFPGRG